VHTLTIGRTLGCPPDAAHRFAESIQDLAASALTELRNMRSPTLGEQAHYGQPARSQPALLYPGRTCCTQPSPSPYFAAQLVDHLYDEDAALVPSRVAGAAFTAGPARDQPA